MTTETASGHTKHLQPWEIETLEAVVDAALAKGWLISVYNGGDTSEIFRSNDRAAILDACGASDDDMLQLFEIVPAERSEHSRAALVGKVWLVYGNEPGVTVADHTLNHQVSELIAPVNNLMLEHETKFADAY
jgi:hypothetical protein